MTLLYIPFLTAEGTVCNVMWKSRIDEDCLDVAKPDVDGEELDFTLDGDGTEWSYLQPNLRCNKWPTMNAWLPTELKYR